MLQSRAMKISNPFKQLQKFVRFSINNTNLKTQKYVKSSENTYENLNKSLNFKMEKSNTENK